MAAADWLAALTQNPWVILTGLVVTAGSLLFAFYAYARNRRVYLSAYAAEDTVLIEDLVSRFDKLQISYDGRPAANISVSRLRWWNAGTETLERADISPVDPLRVDHRDGVEVLDAKIITAPDAATQFDFDPATRTISFGFLEPMQGVLLQVVHTGTAAGDVFVNGTLKRAGKPSLLEEIQRSRRISRAVDRVVSWKPVAFTFIALFSLLALFMVTFIGFMIYQGDYTVLALIGVLLVFPAGSLVKRLIDKQIPKSLR